MKLCCDCKFLINNPNKQWKAGWLCILWMLLTHLHDQVACGSYERKWWKIWREI